MTINHFDIADLSDEGNRILVNDYQERVRYYYFGRNE